MMFELLYTSVVPAGLTEAELIDLLEKSRMKNQKLGITGMLIYYDREVMQILEGDKSKVDALYQTIFEDDRHTSLDVFYQGEIEHRSFTDWSMAFKLLDEKMIKDITAGYEGYDKNISPIHMIKNSPNRGKKTFIDLRDTF
ncbi:BLUF domain-containing protein [Colwellia sp. M166]|uniref:BLUF domain-containing protein n=1 Tax=Colwellia sp. M166 TaxID=2583805 RepID=UPI00211EDAE5|nr:BLUF domain-containing protein [Colwellia sp. M166]UUO22059.1 BLUF domain-containing protein [Colwellia sp. M166]|tara:strand:- start:19447 stop:19869 length:423 start_codon:yes stop_codon:yes gene_type:complete